MIIYAFLEHYPSPYKPYFDTQFERFLLDQHSLKVFAFGKFDGPIAPKVSALGLDRATRYLPTTLRTVPRFLGTLTRHGVSAPFARLARTRRAALPGQTRKQKLLAGLRASLLPLEPPDLCLVHNLITQSRLTFLRRLYPDTPIAMYYHGGELPGVPEVSARDVQAAFAAADVVFTNTESSRDHAVGRGCAAEKLVVSPVGFNLSDFQPPAARVYRRDGFLNLISIGRLSEEKGIRHALQAMAQLRAAGVRDVRYRVIGDGPLGAALRAEAEASQLGETVTFLGAVSFEHLHAELAQADALLLPSVVAGTWQENQACVVQEAMLMRTLVAASTAGGVPESTAPELRQFSYPPETPAQIAQSVMRLRELGPDRLRELGSAGQAFARAKYDIARLNAQLLTVATARGRPPLPGPAG